MSISQREQELLKIDEELEAQQREAEQQADEACRLQDERLQAIIGAARSTTKKPTPSGISVAVREEGTHIATSSPGEQDHKVQSIKARPVPETHDSEIENGTKSPVGVPREIGEKATIRLQQAKLKSIHQDLTKSVARNKVLEQKLSSSQSSVKRVKEENLKLGKQLQNAQAASEKHLNLSKEQELKITDLERQITALEKELKQTDRAAKQNENKNNSRDIRLNRALEEIERYKTMLKQKESARQETAGSDQIQIERLRDENKKLERQKTELLAAFRKQLKLIDVLKRQKMHIEAAKMLSFSEEEFAQIIDV